MALTIREILNNYESKADQSTNDNERKAELDRHYRDQLTQHHPDELNVDMEYESQIGLLVGKPFDILQQLSEFHFASKPVTMHLRPRKESFCTIALLSIAADVSYRLGEKNLPFLNVNDNEEVIKEMAKYGYALTKPIAPLKSADGTGETSLAAMVIEPQDPLSPIVICFRGTASLDDVASDVRLGVGGVVSKKLRDAAYNFYLEVQQQPENVGRKIILTGHSLGGHLAHYVAAKAYSMSAHPSSNLPNLLEKPLLQVRTFNTAPAKTKHSAIFKEYPHITARFINYRLNKDIVSKLPLSNYLGNTFDYWGTTTGRLESHFLRTIQQNLPQNVMSIIVGHHDEAMEHKGLLLELFYGMLESYRCRIRSQTLTTHGHQNLAVFEEQFPRMINDILNSNYDDLIEKLIACKDLIKGEKSKHMIEILMRSINEMGVLQNRLTKMLQCLKSGKIDDDTPLKESGKAHILFKLCMLEPKMDKVESLLTDQNKKIMLKNLQGFLFWHMERADYLVKLLLDDELASLNKKLKKDPPIGIWSRKDKYSQYIQLLKNLRPDGKEFVSSAKAAEILKQAQASASLISLTKSKVFRIIKLVEELQKEKSKAAEANQQMDKSSANLP